MSTVSLAKPKTTQLTNVWPQVDLLPPEVRAGRKFRQTKRLLALLVLAVVLLAVLGWVYALFTLRDANQQVADAQAETDRLTAEQATYAEVPQVQSQLSRAQDAISSATATEILWKGYLEAFRAVTPSGVTYSQMSLSVSSDPSANVSSDPLQSPSIGQISFSGSAATLPDLAAWMDAVRTVPGLADPWFSQANVTDQEGNVSFQISGTVQITDAALAHRFDATSDTATAAGTAPSEAPTATTTGGDS